MIFRKNAVPEQCEQPPEPKTAAKEVEGKRDESYRWPQTVRWEFTVPSTALVEKKPRFLVSRGFSCVKSTPRLWGSDSPVREELSTLKPRLSMTRMSAGILSPNLTSTTSPSTMSSARNVSFSPCRITVANCEPRQRLQIQTLADEID